MDKRTFYDLLFKGMFHLFQHQDPLCELGNEVYGHPVHICITVGLNLKCLNNFKFVRY